MALLNLKNKKIVISAGASGIGWAAAKIFLSKGANVYLCDIDTKNINKIKKHPLNNKRLFVYECDAYTLQKNHPTAVVLPQNTEEIVAVVRLCSENDLPIIPRGAGTSLSGTVLAVEGGVMIALTRMNRILSLDTRNRRALVEAGCVNSWITQEAGNFGLFFAPDPSSQ